MVAIAISARIEVFRTVEDGFIVLLSEKIFGKLVASRVRNSVSPLWRGRYQRTLGWASGEEIAGLSKVRVMTVTKRGVRKEKVCFAAKIVAEITAFRGASLDVLVEVISALDSTIIGFSNKLTRKFRWNQTCGWLTTCWSGRKHLFSHPYEDYGLKRELRRTSSHNWNV